MWALVDDKLTQVAVLFGGGDFPLAFGALLSIHMAMRRDADWSEVHTHTHTHTHKHTQTHTHTHTHTHHTHRLTHTYTCS
jgi:hypothetical protein